MCLAVSEEMGLSRKDGWSGLEKPTAVAGILTHFCSSQSRGRTLSERLNPQENKD